MVAMESINVASRIDLEFTINASPGILFNRLSTPSGLSEWFADNVNVDDNVYTFFWDKTANKAQLINVKENKCIRFSWLNDDGTIDTESYFEFRISQQELTGELALHVTEQLSEDNTEDATSLWNYQIGELKRILGV